jgi:hypothetical protein
MNNEIGDPKRMSSEPEIDDDELDEEAEVSEDTTVILDETGAFTDNVGDVSVEINVEELIAELEGLEDKDAHRKKEIRRRLEELVEDKDFEDTYAIEFDD